MMLNELRLENFRAFKSESFSFAKLNLFVGANNSGKSSALSAINVLAQTIGAGYSNTSPLVLNGEHDELGTFKDAVHGGRANTPLRIGCSAGGDEVAFEVKYRPQRREMELTKFTSYQAGFPKFEYAVVRDRYDVQIGGRKIEDLISQSRKRKPVFRGFLPHVRYREFTGLDPSDREAQKIPKSVVEIDRMLTFLRSKLLRGFSNYESISPFRLQPQRTYLTSGETPSVVGHNGQNAIALLASDASRRGAESLGIAESVGRWLRRSNIAADIRVRHLTDRHFEVTVVDKDGSEHNICDVGFGVSQALPVLVAGIRHVLNRGAPGGAILTVQEPEIHLHPNAQAEMGTFLATVATARGQVFVETHSDALLLRIARHVASGEMRPSEVAIFFVENTEHGRKVSRVTIDEAGGFVPDWPGDFFPQRQIESMSIARLAFGGDKARDQPSLFSF